MTDVLLVYPPGPEIIPEMKKELKAASQDNPPLGLAYLASTLREFDIDVEIFDGNLHRQDAYSHIEKLIKGKPPAIIGFSTATPTFPSALRLSRFIKELSPEIKIVHGGHHVTFMPEAALETDYVDYVVYGEGEYIFAELARSLLKGTPDIKNIPGIAWKESGNIRHNAKRAAPENLDAMPFPARDLLELDKYGNPGTLCSSRGCVAGCTFCAAVAFSGRKYRLRSPENVVSEIIHMQHEYGFKRYMIIDNTFTANVTRTEKICDLIKNLNLNISWACESRADVVSKDLLKKMKDAGCVGIQFGVETGTSNMMTQIKKNVTLDNIRNAVAWSVELGISVAASLIIGFPDETQEMAIKTIEFAKELKMMGGTQVGVVVLTPFPGTEIYENRQNLGLDITDWNMERWDLQYSVMNTRTLSREQITNLVRKGQLELRSTPRLTKVMGE